MIFDHD